MNTAPRAYLITRDGVTVAKTLTMPDAYHYLHTAQGQSAQWAMTHEGWDIITPDGDSLAATYGGGKP